MLSLSAATRIHRNSSATAVCTASRSYSEGASSSSSSIMTASQYGPNSGGEKAKGVPCEDLDSDSSREG
eukprot:2804802-Rhodomonas_salina.1